MTTPSGAPPGSATVVATSTGGAAGAVLAAGAAGPAGGADADGAAEPHAIPSALIEPSQLIVPRTERTCMRGRSHEPALRHTVTHAISRRFI